MDNTSNGVSVSDNGDMTIIFNADGSAVSDNIDKRSPETLPVSSAILEPDVISPLPKNLTDSSSPILGYTGSGKPYLYGVASSYGYRGDADNGLNSLGMYRGSQPWFGKYPTVALNPSYAKTLGVTLPKKNADGTYDLSNSFVTLKYGDKTVTAVYDENGMYINPNSQNKVVDLTPEASAALGTNQKSNAYGVIISGGTGNIDDLNMAGRVKLNKEDSTPNPDPHPTGIANIGSGGNGSARGMFSIPTAGAKVWVFFHGGDPQRPVYFASCPEPNNIATAYQHGSPATLNNQSPTLYTDAHTLAAETGSFGLITQINGGDGIVCDASYGCIESGGAILRLDHSGFNINTKGDHTLAATDSVQNLDTETKYVGGQVLGNLEGGLQYNVGNHKTSAVKASKKIQENVTAIHKAQSDVIKKTQGTKIECPICAQKYAVDKSDFVQRIVRTISRIGNLLPWNCWNWPVTQFLLNMVVVPMLSEVGGLAASGGKGCGACKNGQIESPQDKIEAGNKAAAEELKKRQNSIDQASKKLPDAPVVIKGSDSVYLGAGHIRNDAQAYYDTGIPNTIPKKTEKSTEVPTSTDKCSKTPIVVAGEVTRTHGSIMLDSANDIKIVAGSPGIDILTKGKYKVSAGGVEISGSDGPLVISSNNVTKIVGNTIMFEDKDDGGIRLQANHTSVAGAIHVGGDQYVRGTTTSDAIATKHLTVPSMRSETTMSSSPKSVTDGATWYLEGSLAATMNDRARNFIMRDLNPGWVLTPSGILTIIQEMYNEILSAIPFHIAPIGFCISYPQGFLPVFGYRHTHTLPAQDHSHQLTLPKGNYYNDTASWHDARPETSHVPTPAPGQGDGPSPGPKSSGGCGGGGGFGFGNPSSSASKNRKNRNASVGLVDGEYDYSRITVNNGWKYDGDGNLVPTPEFTIVKECSE